MGFLTFESKQQRGAVDPEYYIHQNKNIKTQYDPENPNYNEQDVLAEKRAKMKENIFYGVVILACLLFFGAILFLSGCGAKNSSVELPVPEYPLSEEFIQDAILKCSLPDDLMIEVNDYIKTEGVDTTFYTLKHPIEEGLPPYLANCMGLLSHKSEKFSSVGLTISSIDKDHETFTEDEMKKAISFATYLLWEETNEAKVYDVFMKDYVPGEQILWEKEIDGIDCQIKYNPNDMTPIFVIGFSTDLEAQLGNAK